MSEPVQVRRVTHVTSSIELNSLIKCVPYLIITGFHTREA